MLRNFKEIVEKEVLAVSGHPRVCEILRNCEQMVERVLLTDGRHAIFSEILSNSEQKVETELLSGSEHAIVCLLLWHYEQSLESGVVTGGGKFSNVRYWEFIRINSDRYLHSGWQIVNIWGSNRYYTDGIL
jgi:hypothetical protein